MATEKRKGKRKEKKRNITCLCGKTMLPKRSGNTTRNGFLTDVNHKHNSVFGITLQDAGLNLKAGDEQDELSVEQSIFLKKLVANLKNHARYPEIIEEFVEGFQQHIEEPNRFRLSLLPISMSEDFEGRCNGQDSLIRMFLGVDILQQTIANMLLEKLPEFMDEENSYSLCTSNLPHLIMNQFRWLDRIVNSKDLTQKMMEMISITSLDVQREIITCLPEVVDDSEHMGIARELREILLQNTRLTVAVLDALSNLNLRPDILSEVRVSVLQMLPSAEVDDLPVVVRFILQSVGDTDAFEVISELRANLDLNSIVPPAASSTPSMLRSSRTGPKVNNEKNGELLTLDAICSGIRFQKSIAEGWIKAIESVNSTSDHKVIDLFVLLILHSTVNRKKAIESLIRNKIKAGHFTEELLSAAFNSHSQILREYFSPLVCLAEVLLRSPEPTVCTYACTIYRLAFVSFDLYCRQEIVGSLVTHIGSGYQVEADSSLDVLCDLATSHTNIVAPFAIFIKGILDYLDNLKIRQIRKLFSILSILAFQNPQEVGLIQDDIHMVIRKQLSSDSKKYKRIGIIGAIMVVKNMARKSASDNDSDETVDAASYKESALSSAIYKEVINMLDLVRTSVSGCPDAAALFFDELAWVIQRGNVDPRVETWISERVVSDFQDDFLVDREAPLPSENLPIELVYGIDELEEGSIAVNILPLLLAPRPSAPIDKQGGEIVPASLECLAPHFRLLRVCEQSQHKGDLEGIDALLGCPLVIFKLELTQQLSTLSQNDKDILCTALFHCVNWFREVVNGFSTQNDVEMRGKTISRLETITTLQKMLEDCLQEYPSFSPPFATFDVEDAPPLTVQTMGGVKRGRKGVKKSFKKEDSIEKLKDLEKENDNDTILENTTAVTQKGKEKDKTLAVSMNHYRPFLRELDLSVFAMLKCGLVSRSVLDSEMNTKETTILQIQPPQLLFLMEDLTRKLEHSLSSSISSKRSFLKVKADKLIGFTNLDGHSPRDVAKFFVDLIPALCDHLEATSAYFQILVVRSDGILDGPERNTEETQSMASCFSQLFNCLQIFFSWSGFLVSGNRDLLKTALTTLSSRTKLSSRTQPGFQDLAKQGFEYLEQFSTTILDLNTAVVLTKLLVAVNERGDGQMKTSIADLCGKFLKQDWIKSDGEKEHGTKFNEAIQHLLRLHLSFSDDVLSTLEEISTGAIAELIEEKQDGLSYQTLTKSTLPSYYKVMMDELVAHLKKSQSSPLKATDTEEIGIVRLTSLNISVRIFHILINLIKAFDVRSVLGSSLKYGRLFMETFMKVGMPLLDQLLRIHKDDVHGLLKNLQQSTRYLHHICGHSKVVKDISLTNHVPAMKKCLETFVFRVKAMLAVNKCHEAFWLGNLKNRDIQGQEILSQVSTRENDEEEAEEDEDTGQEEMEVDEEDNEDEIEESVVSHETGDTEDEEDKESMSESF